MTSSHEFITPQTGQYDPLARAAAAVLIGPPELDGHLSQPVVFSTPQSVTTTTEFLGDLTVITTRKNMSEITTTVRGIQKGNPDLVAAVAGYIVGSAAHGNLTQPSEHGSTPPALPRQPAPPALPESHTPFDDTPPPFADDETLEVKDNDLSLPPAWVLGPRVSDSHLSSGPSASSARETGIQLPVAEGPTRKDRLATIRNLGIMAFGTWATHKVYMTISGSDTFWAIVDDLKNIASLFQR